MVMWWFGLGAVLSLAANIPPPEPPEPPEPPAPPAFSNFLESPPSVDSSIDLPPPPNSMQESPYSEQATPIHTRSRIQTIPPDFGVVACGKATQLDAASRTCVVQECTDGQLLDTKTLECIQPFYSFQSLLDAIPFPAVSFLTFELSFFQQVLIFVVPTLFGVVKIMEFLITL
eukprot:CAMPEP_0175119678 /NCGR_PEP_ID=MMETSP0087-20121206/197_1 /TAXON_ID=136419 /ORGANISM="Unknown Unknown, Strain D1" /LENGTH=172 /DNA_ID=CAMNT_0016401037 /DNA_START=61 /DNA_END=579 /DNA_ORIENTATION=+